MATTSELRFATRAERSFAALERSQLEGSDLGSPLQSSRDELIPHPWENWHDVPCVVLLGEPGSGKTCEFRRRVQELQQAGDPAFMSRWQDWCDGDDIFDTIDDKCSFFSAIESNQPVWWFIDALDEGRIKTEAAFDILRKGLRRLRGDGGLHLVKLRLSCRSRDWRLSEAGQLSIFFDAVGQERKSTESVVTLQLLPLQEPAIRVLAMEKLHEERAVDRFMESLERRHVSALAGHPLTLAMMLSLNLEDNSSLGYDRTTLYDRALERLATEHNRERADRKPPKTLPGERIAVARQLAVRAVLGGNDTIGVPDSDVQSDRILDASRIGAKRFELLETLDTGLFAQHAHGGFVFAHKSFAEYLAARDLSERIVHLPLSRIIPLFPVEHGVIPGPLRETASWLAGLSDTFRRWLIDRDPLTAAQGDTIRYTSEERETLLMSLADRFVDRNWQREFDRFGDLARSVSDSALRRLLQTDRSMAVRQMTVKMIEAAEASRLFPDLLNITLDPEEVPALRAQATGVLAKHAADDLAAVSLSLLQLPQDQDPQDDIAGILAHYLYPHHLTTDQLLQCLHVPRRPSTLSHYRWFWESLFLQRLPATREECRSSLDAMLSLLTDDSDFIPLRPYAEIATSLLISVLQWGAEDIERLGPWLARLGEWIRHHGAPDQALHAQLVAALKGSQGLGPSLLRWKLSNWPDDQEFLPWWHVPFYEVLFDGKDTDCWIELRGQFKNPVRGCLLPRRAVNLGHQNNG
ncbi:NACHT domain-containing protein, partial [Burkholderia ubonensis]|uniref:NACHT domain-containing protein n=1 Tax=Burkholderia ubonensis TaxID=101571 RepID=UPI0012FCEC99